MKPLRVLLVALLVCLLPLRGVLAATMACAQGNGVAQVVAAMPMDHEAGETLAHQHAHHHAHHQGQFAEGFDGADAQLQADDQAAPCHDTCPVCASGCHAVALAADPPLLNSPSLLEVLAYPALAAPAPAFLVDGCERPPRTI